VEQDVLQQQILHYVDHLRFDKAIELINPLLELSSRLVEESEELFMLLQPDFCSSEGIIGSEYSSGGKGEWIHRVWSWAIFLSGAAYFFFFGPFQHLAKEGGVFFQSQSRVLGGRFKPKVN